ncbi:MAG: hypothetical protein ACRERD_02635 [Candidatus Binatia bacterium]
MKFSSRLAVLFVFDHLAPPMLIVPHPVSDGHVPEPKTPPGAPTYRVQRFDADADSA